MVNPIYGDKKLIKKLKVLAEHESFSVGLVIGQQTDDTTYLTHLAPLPFPENDAQDDFEGQEDANKDSQFRKPLSISLVSDGSLAVHASQVVRMLPGGLDVLGIFIIATSTELNDTSNLGKIGAILNSIHKSTSKYYLGTRESSTEKFLLYGYAQSVTIGIKSFNITEQGVFPLCALKPSENKWLQLNYSYSLSYPIYFPVEKSSQSLSKSVLTYFRPWAQALKNTIVLINGKAYDENQELDVLREKSKKKGGQGQEDNDDLLNVVNVEILENQNVSEATSISEFQDCSGTVLFSGAVAGRAFINCKAKTRDCFEAVRNDLIRTIVSRWEMHCDSLVEEPHGSSTHPVLHEPPRRVFLKGADSVISLCDYLFPGDSVADACQSAKELFGIAIEEDDVDDTLEKWADTEQFRKPETNSSYDNEKCFKEIISVKRSNAFQFFIGITVGIIAMVIAYYMITSKR